MLVRPRVRCFAKKFPGIRSSGRIWMRWIASIIMVCGGLGIALVFANAMVNFHAHTMTSAPPLERPAVLGEDLVSIVTFNTWRLCDPARVPAIVQALKTIGGFFSPDASAPHLPDILLFQELECQTSQDLLQETIHETHWFAANVCARKSSGASRSAVGVAVNRSKFDIIGTIALDLGRIFPDHSRCALGARLRSRTTGKTFQVISVHLTPHPLKYRQTEHLLRLLEEHGLFQADGVVLGGDFNFTSRAKSYHLLTQYLQDPLPEDRGQTHWTGGRIDFVFTNDTLTLLAPLNRKMAYEVLRPAGLFRSIYRCVEPTWTDCPLSDHLPEGGIFILHDHEAT